MESNDDAIVLPPYEIIIKEFLASRGYSHIPPGSNTDQETVTGALSPVKYP